MDSEVDRLYKLYPSKCLVSGRPSGKSKKNKDKIKTRLKEYTFEELEYAIIRYKKECVENKVYMKNFSTFLNNIPDYEDTEKSEDEYTDEERYLTIEERQNPDYSYRQKLVYQRKR